jgi:hypothetical protein
MLAETSRQERGMRRVRQLGQWLGDHLGPTRAARRARRCAAARAQLAEALAQRRALDELGPAADADPARTWLAQQLRASAEATAAAARAAIQRDCGALLVAQRIPVMLTTLDGTSLGTATAELLLEPDGRWGGVLEQVPEDPSTLGLPSGTTLELHLYPSGPSRRIQTYQPLPTPTQTTAFEGEGPAPFP